MVASGVTLASAPDWRRRVDGAIVGSALMRDGVAGRGVDEERAAAVLRAWQEA